MIGKLHNQIKMANDNSLKAGVLTYSKDTLTIPLNWQTLLGLMTILSFLLTLFCCVKRFKQRRRNSNSSGVYLTVNQTETASAPSPVRVSDSSANYPGYYSIAELNAPIYAEISSPMYTNSKSSGDPRLRGGVEIQTHNAVTHF